MRKNSLTENFDLYMGLTGEGKYEFPLIKNQIFDIGNINLIPFNYALSTTNKNVGIHFFLDDYQFQRVWMQPARYIEILKQYKFIIGPDFSLYTNLPKVLQMYNKYRNHAISAQAQANGINVIPCLSWSDETSYEWCFDGIEKGSMVAVSSVGCMNNTKAKELFIKGFNEAVERLRPRAILFYGMIPPELLSVENIVHYEPFQARYSKLRGDVV